MKERLADLINVKTIVTFVVTAIFAALSLRGEIPQETVTTVVIMVLGFYFGTQHERRQNNGEYYTRPDPKGE